MFLYVLITLCCLCHGKHLIVQNITKYLCTCMLFIILIKLFWKPTDWRMSIHGFSNNKIYYFYKFQIFLDIAHQTDTIYKTILKIELHVTSINLSKYWITILMLPRIHHFKLTRPADLRLKNYQVADTWRYLSNFITSF